MPTSFRLSASELLQLLVVGVVVVSSSASVSFDLAPVAVAVVAATAVFVGLRYSSGASTNGTASRGNSSRNLLKNFASN